MKDVFRIEMLDISASAGNGLIQGGDVIDVIHAIEYRTDNAVSMFGGRPANHIKVINVRGTVCVQPLSQEISSSLMSASISLMVMVYMSLVLMTKYMLKDFK
ncbi:regulatory protein [Escherichia coli]|nr:regulatory protein [Escherichia coli]